MPFARPTLEYSYKALEPYIDEKTMKIHHTLHHQGYIDNLNKALKGKPILQKLSVEDMMKNIKKVPQDLRQQVINHGGGHANHSFFWKIMSPKKSSPEGVFKDALEKTFSGLDQFKEKFTDKAMSVFGSGWAFLVLTKNKKLELTRHSFQNSPLMDGNIPILGIDVWEHAYYLKYQNKRAEYVKAWWNVVNWGKAQEFFTQNI